MLLEFSAIFLQENHRFINLAYGLINMKEDNKKIKEKINDLIMYYNRIVLENYGTKGCVGKFQRFRRIELWW